MKDKEKFKGFMMIVGELFDKNPSQQLLDVYWQILEPFTDEQCEAAFKKVITTVKFFPKPADFMDHLLPKRFDEIDFYGRPVNYQELPLFNSKEWKERYLEG